MDSAEIVRKLEQAKQAKARLEGQRDRLDADLKALGHETVQSAQAEIERLQNHVNELQPDLDRRVANFLSEHGDTLSAFSGTR